MSFQRSRALLAGWMACCSLMACAARSERAESPFACSAIPANRDLNVTKAVYATGKRLGVSDRVMLASFETGWVESHMNNLGCGLDDSLGVFQQRPSMGWGSRDDVMNVEHSAASFFNRAMDVERRYPGLPAHDIAQKVQVSCCGGRYRDVESKANSLLDEVRWLEPSAPPLEPPPVASFE
ncbi:hypothetical protein [Pendulispora albinea]|uniref:Lipoprotein n=1 Tax=Pendulispora albinea TaxID=2741071 RepID=A0ABZ2M452_9BACT